jgi:hypothetical protein
MKYRLSKWTSVHKTESLGNGSVSGNEEAALVRRAVAALNDGDIEGI